MLYNGDYDYKIKKGKKFIKTLEENITTAYSWNYKIENKNIVKLVEDKIH